MEFGWARVRLTSADCATRLRQISAEAELKDLRFPSPIEAEFTVSRGDLDHVRASEGERLEILAQTGPEKFLAWLKRWHLTIAVVLLLAVLTAWLPGRILFLRVEGNGEVPERLILEAAEGCGLGFGASSRELRSEQVKNHLLHVLPQLRWAGVNISGCTATITVSLRSSEEPVEAELPGDLVAVRDAVVQELYPESGTALAAPGDAVREGQVLLSGMTELGICTRLDRAEGEVYGVTRHTVRAMIPESTVQRTAQGRKITKISLLIGKKRINFTSDSGILDGTCVKMRTVNYLTLPGGFQLPVAVITETWYPAQLESVPRENAEDTLLDFARWYVQRDMIAGRILDEEWSMDGAAVDAVFSCREMIARFREGVTAQGDTNDRENGERGAS